MTSMELVIDTKMAEVPGVISRVRGHRDCKHCQIETKEGEI